MERKKILERLEALQKQDGYLKEEELEKLSKRLDVPLSEIYETASFYSFLETEPKGEHIIRICENLPCRMDGSEDILSHIESSLGIKTGETTDDGKFTLETTSCIGRCDEAPAMMVDDEVYTELTPEKAEKIIERLR